MGSVFTLVTCAEHPDGHPEDAPLRAGMSVVAIVDTGHVRHPRDVLPKGW